MAVLLSAAAGSTESAEQVSQEAREQFRRKLAGLLPAGFTPEGTGPLRALVVYPRVRAKDEVEKFLARELGLPTDSRRAVEYRGTDTDSIAVVLFRSEMSLTQVPEARKVLREWAKAKEDEQYEDVLRWRQRLGYRDDWLVSCEEDRRSILHRLLCCLWNGQVDVLAGDPASPERVRLRLFPETGPDVPGVRLRLGDYPDGVSTWAELLRSYERWTVLDDERTVEDYCRRLMTAQPLGLNRAGSQPHPLFVQLVEETAPRQLELLRKRRELGGEHVEGWMRPLWQFWAETLPAALELGFSEQRAVQPNLRTLLAALRSGRLEPRPGRDAGGQSAGPDERPAARDDWGTTPVRDGADEGRRPRADSWDEDRGRSGHRAEEYQPDGYEPRERRDPLRKQPPDRPTDPDGSYGAATVPDRPSWTDPDWAGDPPPRGDYPPHRYPEDEDA